MQNYMILYAFYSFRVFRNQRYNSYFFDDTQQMITSLSNKQKMSLNTPNYLIFSSANHNSTRSSANRSIQEPYPSIKSEKNEGQRNEPRMFKIRTFGGKAISAKQPRIQGKRLAQEAITCIKEDAQIRVLKCGISNRRPSIQLEKQTKNELSYRSKKQTGSIHSTIFKEIQIMPKQERYQLNFQKVDFSQYAQLSHKPNIHINSKKQKSEDNHEVVVILSMNLLSLDSKKIFKPRQRSYQSQRSVECESQSPFSIDVQNILRNICGQNQKSFFNSCGIYFKVSSYAQLHQLRDFLDENGLVNYDGIIDVKGKITQTHNIYQIDQIISEGQKLILLQQEQTLETDIPLIKNIETLFMTLKGKNLNYNNINKTIKALKNIEMQGGKTRFTQVDSPKKSIIRLEDKQNLHPNNGLTNKKFNRTSRQSKLTSNKKISKRQVFFYVNTVMKAKFFSFDQSLLIYKVHQANKIKKIRHFLRQSKCSFRQNINLPSSSLQKLRQQSRNRSVDTKSRQIDVSRQASFSIHLQGDFKEKLMKYVKILDSQRASKQASKELKNRQRIQSKDDDLEELTLNLTTRVKSKTPYQIVGDLIRNNTHIAKQVEKHINKINKIRQFFDKDEQYLDQIRQITERFIYAFQL